MNKAKGVALTVIMAIFSLILHSPVMAAKYSTLADIREEAKDGWHETYEVKGKSIVVNVDIQVPEVDVVPAVRVTLPQALCEVKLPIAGVIRKDFIEQSGFAYTVFSHENSFLEGPNYAGPAKGEALRLLESDAQAENSPLSREEALQFMLDLANEYEDSFGPQDLEVKLFVPHTREYKVLSRERNGASILDFNQPITEMGYYWIAFYQRFHGIPYLHSTGPFNAPRKGMNFLAPYGRVDGLIASKKDYMFAMEPAVEIGMADENLPLCSFAQAKAEFEKRIKAGYIRDVYEVRFGYLCYQDPENLGNAFILLPVWDLRGSIADEPHSPDPIPLDSREEFTLRYGGQNALVNAQTGILLDAKDAISARGQADILTWDQVGK
jgi:hypothetical protein